MRKPKSKVSNARWILSDDLKPLRRETQQEKNYRERMMQLSWQHHILENSNFTPEREKEIICELYLDAYKANTVALLGKRGLLSTLSKLTSPADNALLGKTVREALSHESNKKDGPSTAPGFKRRIKLLLDFLKLKYPGMPREERKEQLVQIFKTWGLGDFVPTVGALDELLRPVRNRRKKI